MLTSFGFDFILTLEVQKLEISEVRTDSSTTWATASALKQTIYTETY